MSRNKYGAVKVTLDGIVFDSKREAARYQELKLLEKAGEVRGIKVHERFDLEVNDQKICAYEADFTYHKKGKELPWGTPWEEVVEDCKGMKTAVYKLKRKLMWAVYGIVVKET